jgi:hypothetical protein
MELQTTSLDVRRIIEYPPLEGPLLHSVITKGPGRSGLPDELIERLQKNSAPAQRKIDSCFEPF